jgi:hypothetical protein
MNKLIFSEGFIHVAYFGDIKKTLSILKEIFEGKGEGTTARGRLAHN